MQWWIIVIITLIVVLISIYIVIKLIFNGISRLFDDAVIALVYQMDPNEFEKAKPVIEEKYKGRTIIYQRILNEQAFKELYSSLLSNKKKCEKCTYIPLGNVKFLTENLPMDFFDLSK